MAYEFSLDYEFDGPFSDGDGGQVIEFILGFDTDEDLIAVMAVLLTATGKDNALELHFGIRTSINGDEKGDLDYSKEGADNYIPKDNRGMVSFLVRRAIRDVIRASMPEYILMETFYSNLPDKAMAKYEPVCTTVENRGYDLQDHWRSDEDGKDYWVFKRNPAKIDDPKGL